MPSQPSVGAGVPAVHESTSKPPTQLVEPVEAQAPTPQVVDVDTYPSSITPLQSSSKPLQTSSAPGYRRAVGHLSRHREAPYQ
jgi:hypothetical protein